MARSCSNGIFGPEEPSRNAGWAPVLLFHLFSFTEVHAHCDLTRSADSDGRERS
jgi:hypothetical protein